MDDCEDIPLGAVLGVVKVDHQVPPSDWAWQGGVEQEEPEAEENSHFFYQKWLPFHRPTLPRHCLHYIPGMTPSWHGSRTRHPTNPIPTPTTPPSAARAVCGTPVRSERMSPPPAIHECPMMSSGRRARLNTGKLRYTSMSLLITCL